MTDVIRRRSTSHRRRGQGRAGLLAMRLGARMRERRRAMGLTQAQLGGRIGIHQTAVSKMERGKGARFSLETWAAAAAALGYELTAFFEGAPSSDAPVDLEHIRRQQLVVTTGARGGWGARVEHRLVVGGRPLAIDVLLIRPAASGPGELCVVEVWNWLTDIGAAWRNHAAKVAAVRESHPTTRVSGLFVMRATRRNRELVREFGEVFRARFSASSDRMLAALGNRHVPAPEGDAVAWTDAHATRLVPVRARGNPHSRQA